MLYTDYLPNIQSLQYQQLQHAVADKEKRYVAAMCICYVLYASVIFLTEFL